MIERIADLIGASPAEVDSDEKLSTYGVDSSDLLMLVFDVEEKFATKLHPGLFLESETINALAEKISAAL